MASSSGQQSQVFAQNLVPYQYLLRGVDQAEQVLGLGAYGVVFSGDWRGTPVAIKRHHPMLVLDEHGQSSKFYRRFLQEFPMLKELPHPNIVQVFGMVAATGPHDTPGLVMECLSQTLRKRCSVQPALSLLEKCSIALGVSSALDYLHSRSIIHRDLTTNNIMLCEVVEAGDVQLKAKITDVGGAAELDDRTQAQMMTINPGAQTYMAPETQRASNEPGRTQYGTPADCYSFAVCLLAMCVGKEPPNIYTLAREGRVRDLQDLGSDHPFHDIISRCLKVDPAERPTAAYICDSFGAMTEIIRRQQQPAASSSTAGATQINTSEPSPDQAEIARLRQELQEREEQVRDAQQQRATALEALQDRTALLAERDELLRDAEQQLVTAQQAEQDRTAVLAERDQLLHTNQEQLTAAQLAVQDRTVLLAERDELLMRRGAAPELSASTESADAQRVRESLLHLASLKGEAGWFVRCSLLLGRPPAGTRQALPKAKWKAIGNFPIRKGVKSRVNEVVCFNGGVKCTLLEKGDSTWNFRILSGDPTNLSETADGEVNLTHIFRVHRSTAFGFRFIEQKDSLYCIIIYKAAPCIVYKVLEDGEWQEVVQFPDVRFGFRSVSIGNQLIIIGGSTDKSSFKPVRPVVTSFDMTIEGNQEWIDWPDFPAPDRMLRLLSSVAYDGHLHVFGGDPNQPAAAQEVFSAPIMQPAESRTWSRSVLPHHPFWLCRLQVFRGYLVCFKEEYGGSPSQDHSVFMLSPVSRSWQPVPSTDLFNGCPCDVYGRLVVFTPGDVRQLCWESVTSQPRGRIGSWLRR